MYQIYLIVIESLKEESITTRKTVLRDMRRKKKRVTLRSKLTDREENIKQRNDGGKMN